MADKIIVYWRDIPAQILIKDRRRSARRQLALRFIEAIDMCAMRVGAKDSDAYLAQWRRVQLEKVSDGLEAEAERAVEEIESIYTDKRLRELVANAGYELDRENSPDDNHSNRSVN